VVFRHADGSVYGAVLEPQALDAQAKLFSALRHLGLKEREVRVVLTELRADLAFEASASRSCSAKRYAGCTRPSPDPERRPVCNPTLLDDGQYSTAPRCGDVWSRTPAVTW
jgi:hypothetical protein